MRPRFPNLCFGSPTRGELADIRARVSIPQPPVLYKNGYGERGRVGGRKRNKERQRLRLRDRQLNTVIQRDTSSQTGTERPSS